MLNAILANVIAGLGLFFSGLRMVDVNLRQATGRQLRTIISRLTHNAWIAGFVGVATGALVQSSSGIVFIVVSLVTSGLTTVRRALPIVTWANVGCCALIFAAVLDLRLAILYMIGLAGAAFAFDRSHKSHALGALFGVGMLFYGIELMKLGAEPLKDLPYFTALLNETHQSYFLALIGGAAFSFLTQSSTAVSIVAIGVAQTGLVGAYPTMMAIYGANVGSTVARMVLSSALKGSARQITAYQDLFKIAGAALFVVLLYIEAIEGVPLVRAFVARVSGAIDTQMAIVSLLFNLTMAVLFTIAQPAIYRALEWWLPADDQEDLSQPQFLYDEALDEPATALDLIENEQLRLVKRLRGYPAAMRAAATLDEREQARRLHDPFVAVVARIEQFEHDLLNRPLGPGESDRLSGLQNRLNLIVYLNDSLRALVAAAESAPTTERLVNFLSTYIEVLDFVLMTLVDALETGSETALELLLTMTEDRGDVVERMRQEYLAEEGNIGTAERSAMLKVTSVFERIMWMAQRLAHLVGTARRNWPAAAALADDDAMKNIFGTARAAEQNR
jgi:phosphate:Na+ symporter